MQKQLFKVILSTIVLCSCSNETIIQTEQYSNVSFQNFNYDDISDYELVRDAIFDVASDDYYVYFYSMSCSHCEELKNYIIEKALDRGDIYFVKGTSKDQITNDPKKSIGAGIPEDIWILGYPTLLQIQNQKCSKNLAGITQIKAELK